MSDVSSAPSENRRRRPGAWFVGLVLLALLGVLFFWRGGRAPERSVGQKLAALDLVRLGRADESHAPGDLSGRITLADLKGKVALVNLWATWCPYCLDELPMLDRLQREFGGGDFVVLAVSCGDDDPKRLASDTEEVLRQRNLDLTAYADPARTTRRAFRDLAGQTGFPTTFVLDREGVVRATWVGYGAGLEDEMRSTIQKLLDPSP